MQRHRGTYCAHGDAKNLTSPDLNRRIVQVTECAPEAYGGTGFGAVLVCCPELYHHDRKLRKNIPAGMAIRDASLIPLSAVDGSRRISGVAAYAASRAASEASRSPACLRFTRAGGGDE